MLLSLADDHAHDRAQDWDAVLARLRELGADPAKTPSGRRSPIHRLRDLMDEESLHAAQEWWERHRVAAEIDAAMPAGSFTSQRRLRL